MTASPTARPWTPDDGPMPALYLGHGAPPLLDDRLWTAELAAWSGRLPRPRAINEIRLDAAFHAYRRIIWNDLRDEVMKAYGAQDGAGALA